MRTKEWMEGKRDGKLAKILEARGVTDLYLPATVNGQSAYAYPDNACMGFLEYYAYAAPLTNEKALENFRTLSNAGLKVVIYLSVGYDPTNRVPDIWRQYHDRLMLSTVPPGYFSVFREMADFVLVSVQQGLDIDAKTVPDISVGKTWSTYWQQSGLEGPFGPRMTWTHNYPEYFPQAKSNPQEMWVYPVTALGDFRQWLTDQYLPIMFPAYIGRKVKAGDLPASIAALVLGAVETMHQLPPEPPKAPMLKR